MPRAPRPSSRGSRASLSLSSDGRPVTLRNTGERTQMDAYLVPPDLVGKSRIFGSRAQA